MRSSKLGTSPIIVRRRALITGRVQGVNFRAATQRVARELGLAGWVQNRADGRVEWVAAGPGDQVDRLIEWSRRGPPAARVEAIDVHDDPGDDELPHPFAVRRDDQP
jgi:acylphosphatase